MDNERGGKILKLPSLLSREHAIIEHRTKRNYQLSIINYPFIVTCQFPILMS